MPTLAASRDHCVHIATGTRLRASNDPMALVRTAFAFVMQTLVDAVYLSRSVLLGPNARRASIGRLGQNEPRHRSSQRLEAVKITSGIKLKLKRAEHNRCGPVLQHQRFAIELQSMHQSICKLSSLHSRCQHIQHTVSPRVLRPWVLLAPLIKTEHDPLGSVLVPPRVSSQHLQLRLQLTEIQVPPSRVVAPEKNSWCLPDFHSLDLLRHPA